jgi:hypothetical protein
MTNTIETLSDQELVRRVLDRMQVDGHEVDSVEVTEAERGAIQREKKRFQSVRRLGHHVTLSPWLKTLFGVTHE